MPCPVLASGKLLRFCYALSGTEVGCAATRSLRFGVKWWEGFEDVWVVNPFTCLHSLAMRCPGLMQHAMSTRMC